MKKLNVILCGQITRMLRGVRNLKGTVYVVGGVVTEGATLRDIDVVITNPADLPIIKKALGNLSKRTHFMLQSKAPPSPIYITITGQEPSSPELAKAKKGQKIPKYEYANP